MQIEIRRWIKGEYIIDKHVGSNLATTLIFSYEERPIYYVCVFLNTHLHEMWNVLSSYHSIYIERRGKPTGKSLHVFLVQCVVAFMGLNLDVDLVFKFSPLVISKYGPCASRRSSIRKSLSDIILSQCDTLVLYQCVLFSINWKKKCSVTNQKQSTNKFSPTPNYFFFPCMDPKQKIFCFWASAKTVKPKLL